MTAVDDLLATHAGAGRLMAGLLPRGIGSTGQLMMNKMRRPTGDMKQPVKIR
jgi:hypothetical protein